jgi:hypothetical protein
MCNGSTLKVHETPHIFQAFGFKKNVYENLPNVYPMSKKRNILISLSKFEYWNLFT